MSDLADIGRLVSLPQKAVEQAADTLEQGIGQAANRLEEMARLRPNVTSVIARLLGMSDVSQARRMACAIIANAMVFHQRIAGMHQEVKTLRFGLPLYWWHSNRQHSGRGTTTIRKLNHCPSLTSAPSARSNCVPQKPFSTNSGTWS